LLYAIGEIILVVIGILLALQVNNWNNERVQRESMHNYYERMYSEIADEIKSIERFIVKEEKLKSMNMRTLKIIDAQNRDSIPVLRKTIGALGTVWTVEVHLPVVQEFLDQGYLSKIKTDSLKMAFKSFSQGMGRMKIMEDYIENQYDDRIEPYINVHLNYSEVALEQYKERFIAGGPPTDFEFLFNDLEFWNIVTFKLEALGGDISWNKKMIDILENLNAQIRKELDKES
jgi:hypothetical protein